MALKTYVRKPSFKVKDEAQQLSCQGLEIKTDVPENHDVFADYDTEYRKREVNSAPIRLTLVISQYVSCYHRCKRKVKDVFPTSTTLATAARETPTFVYTHSRSMRQLSSGSAIYH